jgi:two-component system nitrogen regulation response regulator NtrX
VNCAAIPSELIESELFGHMKGSFTGAVTDREGKFEQADRGTLFLDEIGDMSASTQAKVLRALQEGVVTPVGGTKPLQVDVRVIAATNRNLEEEIAAGRFREDLYYRLNVVPIQVPPLRERREDIPALVAFFTRQLAGGAGAAGKRFDASAIERLQRRSWPGNVRELRNAIERLLILSPAKFVSGAEVRRLLGDGGSAEPESENPAQSDDSLGEFKEVNEKIFIAAKLREYDWNITETARALKMSRSALYKRIERLELSRDDQ